MITPPTISSKFELKSQAITNLWQTADALPISWTVRNPRTRIRRGSGIVFQLNRSMFITRSSILSRLETQLFLHFRSIFHIFSLIQQIFFLTRQSHKMVKWLEITLNIPFFKDLSFLDWIKVECRFSCNLRLAIAQIEWHGPSFIMKMKSFDQLRSARGIRS